MQFPHFQTKISANQHTNRPFPNSDMPLSNPDCSISPVFQAVARLICGENAVRKRRNCGVFAACTCLISCILVTKVAKWWCDCGIFCRGCGGFYVLFRRLQGLFAVKMQCGNGKMRCENGKNMVRRWQNCGAEMVVVICDFG